MSRNTITNKVQEVEAFLGKLSLSKNLLQIISALESSIPKGKLYLVGGVVRDAFLGKLNSCENIDIDLATDLDANEVLTRLEANNIRVVPTGLQHGTVLAVINESHYEITTFRAGRSLKKETIEDDLSGRDFTINALAYGIQEKKIIDPFFGVRDLNDKILKAVESATDRFNEDPLRVLRAIRFGPASGFQLETDTANSIKTSASKLKTVAIERIRQEIEKFMILPYAAKGIQALADFGLLEFTFPELTATIGFEQNKFHVHDVFDHTIDVISKTPPDLILRLAALYHDIGKVYTLTIDEDGGRHFYDHEKISENICKDSMQRLKFSKDQIEAVSTIVRLHMRPLNCGPTGVRRIIRDSGIYYDQWREFKNADRPVVFDDNLLEQMKENFDKMVHVEKNRVVGSVYGDLSISGEDILTLGIKPGPVVGKVLNFLKELILEHPEKNNPEVLLKIAKDEMSKFLLKSE